MRVRRARAELKRQIAAGERKARELCESAWLDPDGDAASLLVAEVLGSMRGMGSLRTAQTLDELGISSRRRLRGVGINQRRRLRSWLSNKEGAMKPRLVVLAGPTAVGKGTVGQYVRDHFPEVRHSVSTTTRTIRPGEVDGVHYEFVTEAQFDQMIEAGEFLEWAQVHNAYRYGTPKSAVERELAAGHSVLLEIDLQGARNVREQMPNALTIFLAPPSWHELVNRLVGRGTESASEQERRLATARIELASQDEFDHVVVNTDVAEAAREVVALMLDDIE